MSPDPRKPPRGGRPSRNARPAQRGGAGRPPRAPGSTGSPVAAERPKFTNRATILLVVFAILVISYASSMRAYLHQRSQIIDTKTQIARDRAATRAASAEIHDLQHNRAYVEQQVREHLGWVMPGETAYQVLGTDGKPLTGLDKLTDPATIGRQPAKPAWWVKVRESVDAADHPATLVKKPTPKTTINQNTPGSQ